MFSYLCVVTLQFAAPLILCLFFTLMYKSLSGFSWFTPAATIPNDSINEIISTTEGSGDGSGDYIKSEGLDLLQSAQTIQASWHGLRKARLKLWTLIFKLLMFKFYYRFSARKYIRDSLVLLCGGAISPCLQHLRWVCFISHISLKYERLYEITERYLYFFKEIFFYTFLYKKRSKSNTIKRLVFDLEIVCCKLNVYKVH